MPLKLEGDLDIHNLELELKNNIHKYVSMSKVTVKTSKALNYFEHYRNRHSNRTPAISGE